MERRERDPDTGEITYGSGFSDVLAKIGKKLTGKTASKLASKAAEQLVEKGAERVGEKTGEVLGEQICDKFSNRKETTQPVHTGETKEKEIGKILQKETSEDPFQYIKDVYNDVI